MVARTRFNVTLYVLGLSCSLTDQTVGDIPLLTSAFCRNQFHVCTQSTASVAPITYLVAQKAKNVMSPSYSRWGVKISNLYPGPLKSEPFIARW